MANLHLQPDIRISHLRIDLGIFPYLATLAFLGSTLSRLEEIQNFHELVIVAGIKFCAFSILYFFIRGIAISFSHFGKVYFHIVSVMLLGFLGGCVFALGEELGCWIFTYDFKLDLLSRSLSYAIPATFWLPAGSVISRNIKRYKRLRAEVREELLQQESVRLSRSLALLQYEKQIEAQIQTSLNVTSNEASRLLNSLDSTDSKRIPEYLRVISAEFFSLTARSMLRANLFEVVGAARVRQRFSALRTTLSESIHTRPLNPLWFSVMVLVTMILPLMKKHTFEIVIQMLIVVFVTVYLVQSLQLFCLKVAQPPKLLLLLITTTLSIVVPLVFVSQIVGNERKMGNQAGFIILIIAVTALGHLAQAGLLQFEDFRLGSIRELSEIKRSEDEVNLLFLQITRVWARHIHGSITSKLESVAIEIENALKDDDLQAVGRAFERVNQYLKIESVVKRASQEILLDEVHEHVTAWQGLIRIEIKSDISNETIVNVSVREIGLCVEEAILNAIRHGDCSEMQIEILDSSSRIRIVCSDNGVGFVGQPKGFGTQIYDQATAGKWSLKRDTLKDLTVLTLDFAKSDSVQDESTIKTP